MPRIGRTSLIAAAALAATGGTLVGFASCLDFEMKPEQARARLSGTPFPPRDVVYAAGGRAMHYVEAGDPEKPAVIFVHGSPGSWTAFIDYLRDGDLLGRARVVSVDRPGYGGSGSGQPEPSLERQAADLAPVLEACRTPRPAVLVGHSLGGPVVARLAMDRPDLVSGIVLLAPSIDPGLERTKWYQIPAEWKLFSWLVPRDLKTCNAEILPLADELRKMLPLWETIRVPTVLVQGLDDGLVPPANAAFAERVLVHAPLRVVRLPHQGHFLPWERHDLVVKSVLGVLDEAAGEQSVRRAG